MGTKTKIITVPVPKEAAQEIEKVCYEAKARKDMLAFMVEQRIDPTNSTFIECKRDCIEFGIKWARVQDQVERDYLLGYDNRRRWWLDANSGELKLEVSVDET